MNLAGQTAKFDLLNLLNAHFNILKQQITALCTFAAFTDALQKLNKIFN